MLIDLAIHPFDAHVPAMVEVAQVAEARGCSAVWVADHFSGHIVGREWARDPFVSMAAIAAGTQRADVGLLVANMVNRHPAQLAAAVNSMQSLAPGRIRLGVGSGAAPGSRFAGEHEAIGRHLGTAEQRRRDLVDYIEALRAIWRGATAFESDAAGFSGLRGVVDGTVRPALIVGASSWPSIELAIEHADGVNIRTTSALSDQLARLQQVRPDGFEISVLDDIDAWSVAREERLAELSAFGVDRLIIGMSPPHESARLDGLVCLPERP